MNEKRNLVLILAFTVLAVFVIWECQKPNTKDIDVADKETPLDAGASLILTPKNSSGPKYLTYNTPWAFSPPVQNFLPKTTVGQIGQVAGQGPNPESSIANNCECEG